MSSEGTDKQLAAALGRVASGLFVLTVSRGQTETGLLASWVQQCSFQPPKITVVIQQGREIISLLGTGATFTLNILEDGQTDMIAHFGRGFTLKDDAFRDLEIQRRGPGGPILKEALAYLECRVLDRFPVGDHDLILAQVDAGAMLGDGHPMVHIRKNGLHY